MKSDLSNKYEKSFLEAKAHEWGWRGNDALIFVERMLSTNLDLSNQDLVEVLNFVNKKGDFIINKVADTLSKKIMPKLKEAGCPQGDWEVAQNWLQRLGAWQKLWALTEPNPDITVEIIPEPLVAGSKPPVNYPPRQVPLDVTVRYQIPMARNEHLILLEKDGNGDIFCLQPSRHKTSEVGEPIATSKLIAIVSPQKPAVDWWEAAASAEGFLPFQPQQIENLLDWANNARNDCRLWQFEVEIVMPKIEAVAINN
jgi:hypothetical protein